MEKSAKQIPPTQIYVVYEVKSYTNRLNIYEFFDNLKDANTYIKIQEYDNYLSVMPIKLGLDIFKLPEFINSDLKLEIPENHQFIKGWYREILATDEILIDYFSKILSLYLKLDIHKSMEIQFQIRILTKSIKELESRLEKLEKTKTIMVEGEI